MLTFNLKKEWFEKIKNGEKTHEYRIVKPYWFKRLFSVLFDKNRRNGYLNSLNGVDQSKIDRIKKIKEITNI